MSIQQDINSSLGQVGVLAALNPTLQAKAKEGEEIRKINRDEKKTNKQFDIAKKDYLNVEGAQTEAEESEIKAARDKGKKYPDVLLAPGTYAEDMGEEVGKMQKFSEKNLRLAQEKFDIVPSKKNYNNLMNAQGRVNYFKEQQVNVGKPVTEEGQKALEAIQRADEKAANKRANTARRTKLLYGEMERMMPGFKYMEPKKQNKIIKDLGADERKRIKDEAERREKYYGK